MVDEARPAGPVRQNIFRAGQREKWLSLAPWLYGLTLLTSATLLFLIQPMFSKMALPLLGGAPGVWNTAMVFFQSMLLLGYVYAHLLSRYARPKTQLAIHALLLIAAASALPIGLSSWVGEPSTSQPFFWLFALFALSVGLPFLAVSATSPLLQSWFARTGHKDAGDPYFLYAVSNIGSMFGLLSYPVLIEPFFRLSTQSSAWSAAYLLLFTLILGCGCLLLALMRGQQISHAKTPVAAPKFKISAIEIGADTGLGIAGWKEKLFWVGLAFIPSSLMLGTTEHITSEVGSSPFFWVLPLSLFLLTTILAFSKKTFLSSDQIRSLQLGSVALFLLAGWFSLNTTQHGWYLDIIITLFAYFFVAYACHAKLYALRPQTSQLTGFYLLMSVGGVLGGLFSALIAPILFNSLIEFYLLLGLSFLIYARNKQWQSRERKAAIIGSFSVTILLFWSVTPGMNYWPWGQLSILLVSFFALVLLRAKPIATSAMMILMAFATINAKQVGDVLLKKRNFFGVFSVTAFEGQVHALLHGNTNHGIQDRSEGKATTPQAYYDASTPLGQVVSEVTRRVSTKQVGIIGLGAGGLTCYRQPGQEWIYYEINPLIVDVARDDRYFNYLSNCGGGDATQVKLGDGRLLLAREADQKFDLLIVDAFSSDSIPAHLLTTQALEIYLSKLSDHGVLLVHTSNRVLDVPQVTIDIAHQAGVPALYQHYSPPKDTENHVVASNAVVIASTEQALEVFASNPKWKQREASGARPWSDDYTNMLGAMLVLK